jgi:hypothetical protein
MSSLKLFRKKYKKKKPSGKIELKTGSNSDKILLYKESDVL